MFEIQGKVALITGGASGLGLVYAQELLRNGLKAATLADVAEDKGAEALELISKEFGSNKAIFVKTDVTDKGQFENAFKKTIEKFKNVDILINNAGILGDNNWENTIAVNVNGVINGMILGMYGYITKYKSGAEGVIVNASSIFGVDPFVTFPFYSASKAAVLALGDSFGQEGHYKRSKVRVVTICPGVTVTPIVENLDSKYFNEDYKNSYEGIEELPSQTTDYVARAVVHIIKNGPNGSAWVADDSKPAYQIAHFTKEERRLK